jgi:hypothetical protein
MVNKTSNMTTFEPLLFDDVQNGDDTRVDGGQEARNFSGEGALFGSEL